MDFTLPSTRAAAKAAGESKFFTGQKCRNGHLAYRYTASGTCSECINGPRTSGAMPPREPKNPEQAQKMAAMGKFTTIKEQVEPGDFDAVRLGAWAFAIRHCPLLTVDDVWPLHRVKPEHGVLYAIPCHPSDMEAVKEFARSYSSKRPVRMPDHAAMMTKHVKIQPVPAAFDRP